MKVGIVTIYDTENMGNRLQNYALQRALSRYADEVVTVKNKPKLESTLANWKQSSSLADSAVLNWALGKVRKAKLLRFNRRYIPISRGCYWCNEEDTAMKPADRCDVYCAGSDQIWNPHFYRNGMFNFLGFAPKEAAFSYAASFGIEEIPAQYQADVRKGLEHLQYISVREEAGKQIVQELTSRTDVQVLIDPTMLLSAEEWSKILAKPAADLPERYQLMYFLGEVSPERRDVIFQNAQRTNCPVIDLMDPESPFHKIGPDEFLYLIQHTETFYTDSFHGSVFSFLFQRPLAIFDRVDSAGASMGSRLKTFAETFRLQGCIAKQGQLPDIPAQADYSAGYEALEAEREKAFAFLDMVFQKAPEERNEAKL
ncbi:MAG: polysaccharide pyruvyl transferase family protein [Faecousia sp.]